MLSVNSVGGVGGSGDIERIDERLRWRQHIEQRMAALSPRFERLLNVLAKHWNVEELRAEQHILGDHVVQRRSLARAKIGAERRRVVERKLLKRKAKSKKLDELRIVSRFDAHEAHRRQKTIGVFAQILVVLHHRAESKHCLRIVRRFLST